MGRAECSALSGKLQTTAAATSRTHPLPCRATSVSTGAGGHALLAAAGDLSHPLASRIRTGLRSRGTSFKQDLQEGEQTASPSTRNTPAQR